MVTKNETLFWLDAAKRAVLQADSSLALNFILLVETKGSAKNQMPSNNGASVPVGKLLNPFVKALWPSETVLSVAPDRCTRYETPS